MKPNVLNLRIGQFACFAICLCLMIVVPIVHSNKLIGITLEKADEEEAPAMTVTPSGEVVVNTTSICKDVVGYAGPTPVEITLKDGRIEKVKPLDNRETPEFFGSVVNSDLFDSLQGLTLKEASEKQLDGVSGATYTSSALIKNIKAGLAYAMDEKNQVKADDTSREPLTAKFYVTLAVILMGAVLPLLLRSKGYRLAQLMLNVLVLGFWGGTFISYSIMVSALTNGITQVVLIPVALMLVVAFIYPMFGKTNHYCTWICPYGSLQELLGKCIPKKIKISQKVGKTLIAFRNVLWFALMWLLWTGLWFDWMGYEPFAAFFFNDASAVVLGIAGGFLILSLFVQRPYCRFVCPTGTLFKLTEGRK